MVATASGCPSPASLPQLVTFTSLPDELAASSLSLYPNPTPDGYLTLELTGYRQLTALEVIDAVGRVVHRHQLPPHPTETTSVALDLHELPTGIYTLRVFTGQGPVVRRLVRQ